MWRNTERQEGKYCYYSLTNVHIEALLNMLDTIMDDIWCEISCCQLNKKLVGDVS
jgi:hypothetical protein